MKTSKKKKNPKRIKIQVIFPFQNVIIWGKFQGTRTIYVKYNPTNQIKRVECVCVCPAVFSPE